jgi:glycosyltransferase involved in cell wall biosynthesis
MNKPANCPTVTVLVCTLNEEANLVHFLPMIPDWVDEILLVDGHSTDRTVAMAKSMLPKVNVVHQPGSGKGDALRYGFRQAEGEIVVTLDADGSMDPQKICDFISPLLDGYEVSKGSRFLGVRWGSGTEDMDRLRMFGNQIFVSLVNVLYGCGYTDLAYGYNAFKRRAIESLELEGDGFEIETEIMIKIKRANLRTIEIPSFERKRCHGRTNLRNFRDGWRILRVILKERLPEWRLPWPSRHSSGEAVEKAVRGTVQEKKQAEREVLP